MAIQGAEQPLIIQIDTTLRLRKFDGRSDFALPWYQDPKLVYLVDGNENVYTLERIHRMYEYLDHMGELYFIEIIEDGAYKPIGDVTFWPEDMPIVIGDPRYRHRSIGRKVINALVKRGRDLGYDKLYVKEIYAYNEASIRCFESVGFSACEKTEAGARYRLDL